MLPGYSDGRCRRFHRLHGAVADAAPVPAGAPAERSDYDKGTAPGPDAVDAAIVRRIRELCPDARFEGNSDEQLIELFKRNRKVLRGVTKT